MTLCLQTSLAIEKPTFPLGVPTDGIVEFDHSEYRFTSAPKYATTRSVGNYLNGLPALARLEEYPVTFSFQIRAKNTAQALFLHYVNGDTGMRMHFGIDPQWAAKFSQRFSAGAPSFLNDLRDNERVFFDQARRGFFRTGTFIVREVGLVNANAYSGLTFQCEFIFLKTRTELVNKNQTGAATYSGAGGRWYGSIVPESNDSSRVLNPTGPQPPVGFDTRGGFELNELEELGTSVPRRVGFSGNEFRPSGLFFPDFESDQQRVRSDSVVLPADGRDVGVLTPIHGRSANIPENGYLFISLFTAFEFERGIDNVIPDFNALSFYYRAENLSNPDNLRTCVITTWRTRIYVFSRAVYNQFNNRLGGITSLRQSMTRPVFDDIQGDPLLTGAKYLYSYGADRAFQEADDGGFGHIDVCQTNIVQGYTLERQPVPTLGHTPEADDVYVIETAFFFQNDDESSPSAGKMIDFDLRLLKIAPDPVFLESITRPPIDYNTSPGTQEEADPQEGLMTRFAIFTRGMPQGVTSLNFEDGTVDDQGRLVRDSRRGVGFETFAGLNACGWIANTAPIQVTQDLNFLRFYGDFISGARIRIFIQSSFDPAVLTANTRFGGDFYDFASNGYTLVGDGRFDRLVATETGSAAPYTYTSNPDSLITLTTPIIGDGRYYNIIVCITPGRGANFIPDVRGMKFRSSVFTPQALVPPVPPQDYQTSPLSLIGPQRPSDSDTSPSNPTGPQGPSDSDTSPSNPAGPQAPEDPDTSPSE